MEIIDFLRKEKIPLVDIKLLKELSGLTNKQSLASFINSLERYGVLEKAEKGKYLIKDNLGNDFSIANLLYKPSYVSLETVLNLCGVLSQFPMEITSVTTKRKSKKKIAGKLYVYYHLDPKLFWGFEKKEGSLLALPEKALLDSIYLESKGIREIYIDELDLSLIDKKVFTDFAAKFPKSKNMQSKINRVLGKI